MLRFILLLLAVCLTPSLLRAQALADHVQSSVTEYLAWKGADALTPAYGQSHLKQFVGSSKVQQFLEDNLNGWMMKNTGNGPRDQQIAGAFLEAAKICWRHPTAFAFTLSPNARRVVSAGLICAAGADAADLETRLNAFVTATGDESLKVASDENLVSLTNAGDLLHVDPQSCLANNPDFKSSLAQCPGDPALVYYVQPQGDVMRKEMGGIKRFIVTAGFDGKNWSNQLFLSTDGPVPALAVNRAAIDAVSARIPADARLAGVSNMDFSKLLDNIDTMLWATSDSAERQLHSGIASLGFDLQGEFLSALGPSLGFYTENPQPGVFGPGWLRLVLLNSPSNPDQAQAGFDKLKPMFPNSAGMALTGKVKDGILYVGPSPKFVNAAVARPSGDSILSNPAFVAMRKHLGAPEKLDGFSYQDLSKTAETEYPMMVLLGQQALGSTGALGDQTLPGMLPTPEKLAAALEPAGSFLWQDEAGIHFKDLSPFPGAQILAAPEAIAMSAITNTAQVASLMHGAFENTKRQQLLINCMSKMKQIDIALYGYAEAHQQTFPPDLGTLIKTQDIPLDLFLCPGTANKMPPDWQSWSPDQEANWVNNHCDYEYLGPGAKLGKSASRIVVLRDRDNNHGGELINLGFADGHIQIFSLSDAKKAMATSEAILKAQ